MNPALRATAIVVDPAAEWPRIERDSGAVAYLMTRYVALFGLVPAVAQFLGACVIGVIVPGTGLVRAPLFDGFFGATFFYLETFIVVLALALFVQVLAPLFGGRRDFSGALKLAVYSYTPVWLAGVFLVLPGLWFLTLFGFYGGYIASAGLPAVLKVPQPRSRGFAFLIVVCAAVLTIAAVAAQRALFAVPGGY